MRKTNLKNYFLRFYTNNSYLFHIWWPMLQAIVLQVFIRAYSFSCSVEYFGDKSIKKKMKKKNTYCPCWCVTTLKLQSIARVCARIIFLRRWMDLNISYLFGSKWLCWMNRFLIIIHNWKLVKLIIHSVKRRVTDVSIITVEFSPMHIIDSTWKEPLLAFQLFEDCPKWKNEKK